MSKKIIKGFGLGEARDKELENIAGEIVDLSEEASVEHTTDAFGSVAVAYEDFQKKVHKTSTTSISDKIKAERTNINTEFIYIMNGAEQERAKGVEFKVAACDKLDPLVTKYKDTLGKKTGSSLSTSTLDTAKKDFSEITAVLDTLDLSIFYERMIASLTRYKSYQKAFLNRKNKNKSAADEKQALIDAINDELIPSLELASKKHPEQDDLCDKVQAIFSTWAAIINGRKGGSSKKSK